MVKADSLVVKLGTRSTDSGEAELSHEIAMKFDTDVLHRGVVFDNQRLFHVGFLALRFEVDPHEAEVIVDEILEFIETDVLERRDVHDGPCLGKGGTCPSDVMLGGDIDFVDGDDRLFVDTVAGQGINDLLGG